MNWKNQTMDDSQRTPYTVRNVAANTLRNAVTQRGRHAQHNSRNNNSFE